MTLKERIKNDTIDGLKKGDKEKALTLRMLQAAIKNKEIDLKKREEGLSDEETLGVISSEAKKRRDAIEAYQKGNRKDLVQKEQAELAILQVYLPLPLTDEEITGEVVKVIEETGAATPADIGKVMNSVMKRLKGKADGANVSAIVKKMLV